MPHDTRPTSVTHATTSPPAGGLRAWPTKSDLGQMALRRRLRGGWPTWAILAHEAGIRRSRGDRLQAIVVCDALRPREIQRLADTIRARRAEFRTFDNFARTCHALTTRPETA